MRKILSTIAAMLITGSLFAGGLVSNTNQSALFTRLQNRNASTSIDAVYYNPAGLTKLGNGLFVSINNQTISQTKTVLHNYQFLSGSPKEFVGDVSAPIFPGVYAAFNAGKFSVSAGFNPIGGGGGATYNTGLPSFETRVADLPPLLSAQSIPTTAYSADIFFEGTSVYFGYQLNVAYKINDMISVGAGLRMVTAKNTYLGHMSDIRINPNRTSFGASYNGTNMVSAPQFFTDASTTLAPLSSGAQSLVTGLAGVPAATPLTSLPATTQAQIAGVLAMAGVSGGTTVGTATTALTSVAGLSGTMLGYASATGNIEVDAEETATGYAPILSVNITPVEMLNVSVRYEFATELEMTTKVIGNKNGGGMFVDGSKYFADMPAMLAFGAELRPIDKLMVTASLNSYFDKNLDTRAINENTIDKNFLEYGLGAELGLTDKLRVSAGWVSTVTGVNDNYQSDQTYSTNTNSIGAGFGFRVTDMIDINVGGQYTIYEDDTKTFSHELGGAGRSGVFFPAIETYSKKTWLIGVGLDLNFGL